MGDPDRDERELLAEVVTGERGLDDPEVAALAGDPQLAAELRDLRGMAAALDQQGAERRSELAAAKPDEEGLALARRLMRDHGPRRTVARRSRWRRITGIGAVVLPAAVLVVWLALRDTSAGSADHRDTFGPVLGARQLKVTPSESDETFDHFAVDGVDAGTYLYYRFTVRSGDVEIRSDDLERPEWKPRPAELRKLGDTVEWWCEGLPANGGGGLEIIARSRATRTRR